MTFLPGQTSVLFQLKMTGDGTVTGPRSATISAALPGAPVAMATVVVTDDELPTLRLIAPAAKEGATSTISVGLSGVAGTDMVVDVTSSDPSRLTVPVTATISKGSNVGNIAVTGIENALREGTQPVTVTVSAPGFTSDSTVVSVLDNDADHFTFDAIESPKVRGLAFPVSINARDINGVLISNSTGTVSLAATGDAGAISLAPANATFTTGPWKGNVTVNTFSDNVRLTVDDGAGHTGTSNPFEVTHGAPTQYTWSPIASSQVVGQPFTATITALDAGGNLTPDYSGYVLFSSRCLDQTLILDEWRTNRVRPRRQLAGKSSAHLLLPDPARSLH